MPKQKTCELHEVRFVLQTGMFVNMPPLRLCTYMVTYYTRSITINTCLLSARFRYVLYVILAWKRQLVTYVLRIAHMYVTQQLLKISYTTNISMLGHVFFVSPQQSVVYRKGVIITGHNQYLAWYLSFILQVVNTRNTFLVL